MRSSSKIFTANSCAFSENVHNLLNYLLITSWQTYSDSEDPDSKALVCVDSVLTGSQLLERSVEESSSSLLLASSSWSDYKCPFFPRNVRMLLWRCLFMPMISHVDISGAILYWARDLSGIHHTHTCSQWQLCSINSITSVRGGSALHFIDCGDICPPCSPSSAAYVWSLLAWLHISFWQRILTFTSVQTWLSDEWIVRVVLVLVDRHADTWTGIQ